MTIERMNHVVSITNQLSSHDVLFFYTFRLTRRVFKTYSFLNKYTGHLRTTQTLIYEDTNKSSAFKVFSVCLYLFFFFSFFFQALCECGTCCFVYFCLFFVCFVFAISKSASQHVTYGVKNHSPLSAIYLAQSINQSVNQSISQSINQSLLPRVK